MNYVTTLFPESLWQPSPKNKTDYLVKLEIGYNRSKNSEITVCGLARNIEKTLLYSIDRVERLRQYFKKVNLLVYTNDNTDATLDILKKWDSARVISENLGDKFYDDGINRDRMSNMAYYRNRCRDFVTKYYPSSDFYILYDFDIKGGFSYEGLISSFAYGFDVMGANSLIYDEYKGKKRRLYYDAIAYRRIGSNKRHDSTDINLVKYERGELPIKVKSVFGGLCIYTNEVFTNKSFKYFGINKEGEPDCEHVSFHEQIHQTAFKGIFLNPSMITLYNSHCYMLD